MRERLTPKELLAALAAGERLEAHTRTPYAGEEVEYWPHTDVVDGRPTGHPDCYPWHVVGRPDYDRLRHTEVVVVERPAPTPTEGFYVSARYRDRAVLLLGPYATHQEALDNVDRASRFVVEHDVRGWLYAYGTLRGEMKPGRELPAGRLNDRLGLTA